jgi:LacI family transcriptional regulator
VTLAQIAKETSLSLSSVSAVLSGRHVQRRISAETVERVLNVAKKLHYLPNVTARSLRARGSGQAKIVISILTSHEAPFAFVGQLIRATEMALGTRGLDCAVNVELFHAGRLHEISGLRNGLRCNGALLTNTIDIDDQYLASSQFPFPVVLLGRRISGYPSVSVKSDLIGRKAAEILLQAGRRKLAVLQSSLLTQATRSRLSAFVTTAEQTAGITPTIITCDALTEAAGFNAMERFLRFKSGCDGVFAVSDILAIGAYHAVHKAGYNIPGDLAFVGVGDSPVSQFLSPPLTGFATAEEAQHQTSIELLLDLVTGASLETKHVELPVTPIRRESSGHV